MRYLSPDCLYIILKLLILSTFAVITLFPFGSLPFSIGFTPTFLDLALVGLFFVWILPYILGEEQRIIATPVGGGVAVFALLAVAAFVAGLSHGVVTTYLIRHFTEVLLSIATFFLVVNTVKDVKRLQYLLRLADPDDHSCCDDWHYSYIFCLKH